MQERAFSFIPVNSRPPKPRSLGITEIRGPYYTMLGPRYLEDILETMHPYVDGLKFAAGSFALMEKNVVKKYIDLAHRYNSYVSTLGWIENVLRYGPDAVEKYITEASNLGFDMIDLSVGFISMPTEDLFRLVERVNKAGLKAKPELGIM
jgi:phosphosulfolactate synthase (CoM biosynthesis protein A)